MSSWKWAIVHLVIFSAFCLGYCVGKPRKEVFVYRPSSDAYFEIKADLDSVKHLLPAKTDTAYKDEELIILRQPEGYVDVLKKFAPRKSFANYIVPGKFHGKVPPLNFSTCEWGKQFITRTRQDVTDTAEFAGYYAFASWGCGAPCQMCSVIDLRTGNVYAGPYAAGGYEYHSNSRILIVNPPRENGFYDANGAMPYPEQYLWTGTSFKRLE